MEMTKYFVYSWSAVLSFPWSFVFPALTHRVTPHAYFPSYRFPQFGDVVQQTPEGPTSRPVSKLGLLRSFLRWNRLPNLIAAFFGIAPVPNVANVPNQFRAR